MRPARDRSARHSGRLLPALVMILALAALVSACSPQATPTPVVISGIPFPEVARISVEEAAAHHAAGTALFVDVRAEQYYAQGHIPSSVSLPLATIESTWTTLPKARLVITVCT